MKTIIAIIMIVVGILFWVLNLCNMLPEGSTMGTVWIVGAILLVWMPDRKVK